MGQRQITPPPRLSIILPVYNVDPYLHKCLDSIQGQTFTDWEAILVDDGSRDFSGLICDSYAKRDPRFRVIHQENQGVSAARNAGLDVARGELLAFIDPDDFISLNYFELLIAELDRTGADVAVSADDLVQEDGTQTRLLKAFSCGLQYLLMAEQRIYWGDDVAEFALSGPPWGKLFRRDLWGAARFSLKINLSEDIAVVPGVLVRAGGIVTAPGAMYHYRVRRNSLVRSPIPWDRFVRSLAANEIMYRQIVESGKATPDEFKAVRFLYDKRSVEAYKEASRDKRSFLFLLYTGRREACELVDGGVLDE